MAEQLRDKVATGVAWSIAEKIGSMLLQMAVSIIVARLLVPEDFGVMAIMTFFTALALVVVDSGFSQTLIRKKSPTKNEYKSVFVFNIAVSWLLYAVLVAAAPAIARFYGLEAIAKIAPVLFLLLPINALCVIQNTIFTREFRFDLLSKINFAASLVAGAIAIGLAWAGAGVWALVGQRIGMMATRALLLWMFGRWKTKGRFSVKVLTSMAPFSLRLMSTDIIAAVYNNIAQMFIGKMYTASTLGYFNQAQKLKELPVASAVQSVQSVTYPALANIRHNEAKFAESYRKILMITAFVMFPVMVGMIAVSEDMFALLLGEKWMPTVPYFRVLSLCGIFYPLAMIAYNVLKAGSDGAIIVRLEIAKKMVMTLLLALTIPHSAMAVAWGLAAMAAIEAGINIAASLRYAAIGIRALLRTLTPVALLTAAMYAAVVGLNHALADWSIGARFATAVCAGAIFYALGAFVCRLEAVRELREVAKRFRP
ncbi:MAG: lipopolysaccharide biosynthesis protein [Alistipes sp.]